MKLEELERKIYRPESDLGERPEPPEIFEPGRKEEKAKLGEWPTREKRKLSPQQKKYLHLAGLSFAVVFLLAAGLMFWRGFISFDKEKVKLEIKGPERAVSGDEITYTIRYKNNSQTALKNVRLVFYYPEESLPLSGRDLIQALDLKDLGPGQENQTELKARIIGAKDSQKKALAKLSYKPLNMSSDFESQAEFSTVILLVPLILDFDLPERLVSGQSFSFSLEYLNQSEVVFKDLELRLEYPAGFNLKSAEPQPSERDNVWFVGDLMAKETDKIFINGFIEGQEGESKSFGARFGALKDGQFIPYAEIVESLQISVSPLFVSQTVNGSADYIARAGEVLNYQIDYRNTTEVGIKDAVITSQLDGQVLDLKGLEPGQGSVTFFAPFSFSPLITWNAGNQPDLAFLGPHQTGQIRFSAKIKDSLTIDDYSDRNFTVVNEVKIDSSQVPLSLANIQIKGQSRLITKIASQLTLRAKGFFRDDLIQNSGPIPPRVGQTTTYTIKWQLSNTANDLKEVKVSAYLPPHVQWLNKIEPAGADLKYNPSTGQLVWSFGDLKAGAGLLLPVEQASFQIAITPGQSHLGSLLELIGRSTAAGQDSFTGLAIESSDEPIDTDLPDDLTVSQQDGVIRDSP